MKLCHMTGHKVGTITYVHIFACTPEIREGQQVENLAQFRSIFEFDRKYLKNRSRYQKSETNLIDRHLRWVQHKNVVNFNLLTKTLQTEMLTYTKWTMRVPHMLMRWSNRAT